MNKDLIDISHLALRVSDLPHFLFVNVVELDFRKMLVKLSLGIVHASNFVALP